MTDVEQLVREQYLAAVSGPPAGPDGATAVSLVREARSRRRGRLALGSLAAVAVIAGVALGAATLGGTATPPVTTPPVTSPSPPTSPAPTPGVTYVTSMPGITGVADPSTLGEPTASGIAGAPELYPLTQAVLDKAGPGWGYVVFGGRSCDTGATGADGVLALVSPDGLAFRAATVPDELCNVRPMDQTGALVLVAAGDGDTNQPMYVANVLAGSLDRIKTGADESLPQQWLLRDGHGIVAFSIDGRPPVVVSIADDGSQSIVNLGLPWTSQAIQWGASGDTLLLAATRATDPPWWGWSWYALPWGADAPHRIYVTVPPGTSLGDDCEQYDGATLGGPMFGCDFDADGNPSAVYRLAADGTISPVTPPPDLANWVQAEATDAGIVYDWGEGPQSVLDASVLVAAAPVTEFRVQSTPLVDTSTPLADSVQGIVASAPRPDAGYTEVIALARPQDTMVVLGPTIGGEPSAAGAWLWWARG